MIHATKQEENQISKLSEKIRKSNRPPHYQKVNETIRQQIIDQACHQGLPLRQIAQTLGIKYSTAKAIVQVYQNEGRIGKKTTRDKRAFQEIETYMIIVHKSTGKIEKLKHKSECNDLKANFMNSKQSLEETHYSQIAQYLEKYSQNEDLKPLLSLNEDVIKLSKLLNEQYKQINQQTVPAKQELI